MQPVAVLGATGFVGALVIERAREAGLPIRLVGRRREALEERARSGEEIRVADARADAQLRDAFGGCSVVVSSAGPFLGHGETVVEAALAAGAHYVDTSAEQAFARRVYERFGDAERVVLTSFGFDYAVGDFAARLAAEGLEPLDELVVAYATERFIPSAGTRTTAADLVAQPQVAYEDGRLVESRFGATTRRVRFPDGEKSVVEWFGEPLTVPRHTDVRSVRSYLRAPAVAARVGGVARFAGPLLRLTGRVGGGPSAGLRGQSRFVVVAEARGSGGRRRATLTGRDIYGLTALLVMGAAEALQRDEVRGTGPLAPAEAFEARPFLDRLRPLLSAPSVEDL